MILGGSTNAVLHLIAIAHSVGIQLDVDAFQAVADRTPFLADLKPSGKYVMEDVYKIGGIPSKSHILPKLISFLRWVEVNTCMHDMNTCLFSQVFIHSAISLRSPSLEARPRLKGSTRPRAGRAGT